MLPRIRSDEVSALKYSSPPAGLMRQWDDPPHDA
jgi:hypothetical protein